ncbi:MAG: cytochrome [Solirubrobacterales bacterium]|jgi:cytochrome P450|nr:cytochrome [Solirubrobacterales bacterium]
MSAAAGLPNPVRMPVPAQALAWLARPVPFLMGQAARHGDVFTMTLPQEGPWVVLSHPDAIREVFTGDPSRLLAGEGNEILSPLLGPRSVLLLDGPEHLRERRLLLPPFHGERMQRYGALMREVAEREIARWPTGTAFPLAPRMQAVTLEIILRAVFGLEQGAKLDALRAGLNDLLEFVSTPAAFTVVVSIGAERAVRIPAFRRRLEPVDRLILEEIRSRRGATDLEQREDILSLLLQARDEAGEPMGDDELRDELVTLLVAGHETTATALSWAVERLLRTPGAMERLRDDGPAYVQAVCHETLRLRPVIPLVLRRLTEPMTIAGHDLPAGVKVAPCVTLVHRRADLYPEPHVFRPERFLGVKPGTYTWIPFGGGVRRCLGAAFALFEMQAVLEAIAARTTLRPSSPEPEHTMRRTITFAPDRGASVVLAA